MGAFALAYAVHKAASPIRFPPTVALTPVRCHASRARLHCPRADALRVLRVAERIMMIRDEPNVMRDLQAAIDRKITVAVS